MSLSWTLTLCLGCYLMAAYLALSAYGPKSERMQDYDLKIQKTMRKQMKFLLVMGTVLLGAALTLY